MSTEPILETSRLVLREMSMGDLDFVAAMLADPEVMRYFPKPLSREESRTWIRRQQERYEKFGHGYWMAVGKDGGQPVGQIGVLPSEIDGVIEEAIGYLVQRACWRRGYASEGAAACRDYTFYDLDRTRVVSLVRPINEPSIGVATKVGLELERSTQWAGYEHLLFSLARDNRRG